MRIKLLRSIVFSWLSIILAITSNAQNPVLDTCTYSFDFENGSVGPWSSYPSAQDIGYDPTIWVKNIAEFSKGMSLVREITPNFEIGYIFGVRKKVDIYVDQSSILSFNYYIKNRLKTESIRVKFGFVDGTKMEKNIPHNSQFNNGVCEVKFSELFPKKETKHLEGIAFMAVCPKADPEALYRFAVDDIIINGKQAKNWLIKSPETHKLDEWNDFISARHYKQGAELSISGEVPLIATSATVHLSRALTGENSKTYTMTGKDQKWGIKLPLDSAGFWRATLTATDKNDNTISSSLVYLVKPFTAPKGHPWLFMSPGDEEDILSKADTGNLKEAWENIQKAARNKRNKYNTDDFNYNTDVYDEKYWIPTYPEYAKAITAPGGYIRSNSVVYALTKNDSAGESARAALLKMAEWPTYVHPHILNQGQYTYWPVGLALIDLALGYDFVYNSLSVPERTKIADALFNKGVLPVYNEYVRDNRASGNTTNWISHTTGGGILCAVSIMNEYPDNKLEPYLSGMILKLGKFIDMTFDEDGSYGEGYSYHNFTMQTLSEIMPVLENNFGVRFPKKIGPSYQYLLYQMNTATGKLLDFGDTDDKYNGVIGAKAPHMHNFSYIISKYRDPYLKWLYDLSPGKTDKDLFLMDDNVSSKDPKELPSIKHFREVGTVVFRNGFEDNDFHFVFRCGPFFNHQHFDQGSFFLSDAAEEFIVEGGKTDYYNDPWYQKLFIQPGGHNCILVDGNSESQQVGDVKNDVKAWQDYAEITDFLEFEKGAFVSGNLTKIYKGKFENLSRNILYLKPRTIILIDQGLGANNVNEMNLRFHAPRKKDISINGNIAKIQGNESTLTINTISSNKFRSEILQRPMSLSEFKKENKITMTARGFLELSSESNSFINVLTTDNDIISSLDVINTDNYTQFKIDNTIYFVNNKAGKLITINRIKTDALIYSSKKKSYTAFRVKQIIEGSKTLFTAKSPISIDVQHGKTTTIKYSASQETEIGFYSNAKPQKIEINGILITNWTYDSLSIILNIPQEEGIIKIYE